MIKALSFDLDDTLWPIAPTIARAEQALHAFMQAHVPQLAAKWPIELMRALRDDVAASHPEIAHDFGEQRRRSLGVVFADHDAREQLIERAYEVFYSARNNVTLFSDAASVLAQLAARYRLASLSNGNADLGRIGLAHHFEHTISAREVGVMKPDPAIFDHLCQTLKLGAEALAHIGDDPLMDVLGAKRAGLFAIWLNRDGQPWPHDERPDLEIADLHELVAWLDASSATTKEQV